MRFKLFDILARINNRKIVRASPFDMKSESSKLKFLKVLIFIFHWGFHKALNGGEHGCKPPSFHSKFITEGFVAQ